MRAKGPGACGRSCSTIVSAPLRRDVKPATYICSAHSYPIGAGAPLSSSLRRTFEQVADETPSRDAIPSAQVKRSEGFTGSIFVKVGRVPAASHCQQGFWSGTCTSTVDISLGTTIRSADGQVLLSTSAGSTRSADGPTGPGCGDAGSAMAEATSRTMKDALERLAERMANSTALRATSPAVAASPARWNDCFASSAVRLQLARQRQLFNAVPRHHGSRSNGSEADIWQPILASEVRAYSAG